MVLLRKSRNLLFLLFRFIEQKLHTYTITSLHTLLDMDEEPPAKKQMLEEKNIDSIQKEVDFSEFRIDQVLLNDVKSKRVHVLGIVIRRFPFVMLFAPSSVVK